VRYLCSDLVIRIGNEVSRNPAQTDVQNTVMRIQEQDRRNSFPTVFNLKVQDSEQGVIRSSWRLDILEVYILALNTLSIHKYTMSESRENVHNFAAGPSPLPTPVLQKAAEGLLNYNGTGMGVCELSHRGKDFKAIIEGAEGKLAAA
jgi:hypothetical protein